MDILGQHVMHGKYGVGVVVEISAEKIIVDFNGYTTTFLFPDAFEKHLKAVDVEFSKCVADALTEKASREVASNRETVRDYAKPEYSRQTELGYTINPLLGERSKTITFSSESDAFLVIGYLSAPNRISSIEAEVPMDGRNREFERLFPGQPYRPIMLSYTPSGMPNKLSPQFRINLSNITNCPRVLRDNLGVGNGSCAARINKSRFVVTLVQKYGFQFGDRQNRDQIREIAERAGHLDDFIRGLAL